MKFEFEFFFFSLDFGFWFFFLLSLVLGFRLFSFFAFYLFRFSAAFRSVSALARHERRRNGRLDQFLFWKNFVRRKNAPPPRPPRPFFFNSSLPFRGTSHSYFSLSLLLSVPTSITPYQKKKKQVPGSSTSSPPAPPVSTLASPSTTRPSSCRARRTSSCPETNTPGAEGSSARSSRTRPTPMRADTRGPFWTLTAWSGPTRRGRRRGRPWRTASGTW